MLKRNIDLIPEESLADASDYISSLIVVSVPPQKGESEREKAYRTLQSLIREVKPPIDEKKELMEYLDERYGPIN
jgi:hypothetical protein